jgi:adenylate cyclase regulatory protein
MAADVDLEASGLLDGLEGDARRERTELIAWLLDRGFTLDHIRGSAAAPLLLPAHRVLGDDGTYVSAREICESTGVELELLQRLQSAVGLPRIEDPDAAVLPRVDGEAAAHAKFFIDMGVLLLAPTNDDDSHLAKCGRLRPAEEPGHRLQRSAELPVCRGVAAELIEQPAR